MFGRYLGDLRRSQEGKIPPEPSLAQGTAVAFVNEKCTYLHDLYDILVEAHGRAKCRMLFVLLSIAFFLLLPFLFAILLFEFFWILKLLQSHVAPAAEKPPRANLEPNRLSSSSSIRNLSTIKKTVSFSTKPSDMVKYFSHTLLAWKQIIVKTSEGACGICDFQRVSGQAGNSYLV